MDGLQIVTKANGFQVHSAGFEIGVYEHTIAVHGLPGPENLREVAAMLVAAADEYDRRSIAQKEVPSDR